MGPDGKVHDSIRVPSDAVGMIIGKRGDTIREIQNLSGCKINVAQSSGDGEVDREIALIGTADSVGRAKMAIDEKVDAVVSFFFLVFPWWEGFARAAGRVGANCSRG